MADTCGTVEISTLLVETNPFTTPLNDGTPVFARGYAYVDEQWHGALKDLLNRVDAAKCWRCDEPVGFVLYGDSDQFTEWVSTGLAREGDGPVAVLCEECTPYVPERPGADTTPVDAGPYELPPHLRDDAPFAVCSRCQRKTWSTREFGQECRMPQPDGHSCGGRFSNPVAQP